MFAASISAEPTQVVGPSHPLLVTVVCAHAGPASTASSKRIVDSIKKWGGVFDDCFHGSLLVLAAAIGRISNRPTTDWQTQPAGY